MWHLLHGPNEIARDEELAAMKTSIGDEPVASINTTQLDMTAPFKDIQAACDTVSFLADKRLVIVRNWLTKPGIPKNKQAKGNEEQLARLAAYLPSLPESTALVFLEDATIPETHPLVKLAGNDDAHGRVKRFDLPEDAVKWVAESAARKGGQIALPAAKLLASKINRGEKNDRDHFADDSRLYLRKMDNELEKLVAYANGRRIETSDVELLVADEEISDMFKFIDAVSVRDGRAAYRLMSGILARGESPLVIMSMLARQTRLMISAKEFQNLNGDQLAQAMNVKPFVAQKSSQQARRFSVPELERAHTAIMEADLAIKTGRIDELAALDTLVAVFCGAVS